MEEQPSLNLSDLEGLGLLERPPAGEAPRKRAEARIQSMLTLLAGRYRATWAARFKEARPTVADYIAAALDRRAIKANPMAESETSGPFNVRWTSESTRGSWFLAAELADLDRLFGKGGSRTVRTPAPDTVRKLNRLPASELLHGPMPAGVELAHDWSEDDV